jgi:hypothetical protein
MIYIGLDLGGNEPAVGPGQDLSLDHQLNQSAERGRFQNADRLVEIPWS